MSKAAPTLRAKKAYVALMMAVISRGLVAASQSDPVVREEVAAFAAGYRIAMTVHPSGPGFVLEKRADGSLRRATDEGGSVADLTIRFKHISHAFLVFTFQEGTARAFANDRMVADGEVSDAIRLVRCLNRMETLILPKRVAKRAVKDYGALGFGEKLSVGSRIYGRIAGAFITGK